MSGNEGMRSQGSHEHRELRRADLHPDPIGQFLRWFEDAEAAGIALPNAMALATTGADGQPSVRHVLLRDADRRGFVFYTNHGSRKARQLDENPRAGRDRRELEARVGDMSARFRDEPIPRPPHWGGYRLRPDAVEFWQGRPFRLHDRFLYTRDADEGTGWRVERLSP